MPRDDAELEVEPLAVFVLGVAGRNAGGGEALGEARFGAAAQFGCLVDRGAALADREARQDRLMRARAEGAALRDLDGRGERLGQIGEQRDHLGAGLEAVLGRELAAVGLGDQAAFGDADQRVMGLVVAAAGKERLVGGDQRDRFGVGELDQHRLGLPLAGAPWRCNST